MQRKMQSEPHAMRFNNHAGGLPYVDSLLDDEIARHVALCKGWRKTRADVLLMRQKNGA